MAPRTLTWLVLFAFLFALFLRIQSSETQTNALTLQREQNTYLELRRKIVERYVDTVDEKKLFYGALQGMASSLDQHTVFYPPDIYQLQKSATSGHFVGIGIEISWDKENGLVILTPIRGTPAFKAGLMPQDRIIKVGDQNTEKMALEDASKLIRGAPGTEVRITVRRKDIDIPIEIPVIRGNIKIESVKDAGLLKTPMTLTARVPATSPKIGYVRLKSFQEESAADLKKALLEMESKGLQALVLDLRQNGGGLLSSAINICDMFIPKGRIVSTRARLKGGMQAPEQVNEARVEGTHPNYPIAILVDKFSASASEIVSGCLKDHKRAILLGDKTYGKGSVQTILSMDLGELGEGAVKLTTAKYYTPSGISIDGKGIEPDYSIPFTTEQLIQLKIEQRKRSLWGNDPRNHGQPPPTKVPPPPSDEPASDTPPFHDTQLEKAIEVLTKTLSKKKLKP